SSLLRDPAHSSTYPLSLHDALPIFEELLPNRPPPARLPPAPPPVGRPPLPAGRPPPPEPPGRPPGLRPDLSCCAIVVRLISSCRSEEHTSELQSRENLVCRLLLEKK